MTRRIAPAAGTGRRSRPPVPRRLNRGDGGQRTVLGRSPCAPACVPAHSRPMPLPRSPAAPPLHRTDRISRRPPLDRCAFPAPASLSAGLPHMPMSGHVLELLNAMRTRKRAFSIFAQ
jgi:hypothetical protein